MMERGRRDTSSHGRKERVCRTERAAAGTADTIKCPIEEWELGIMENARSDEDEKESREMAS